MGVNNMTSTVYERVYSDMGGVDFSSEPSQVSPRQFAYLENMYRDYACGSGSVVETIPGYRKVALFDGAVHALHPHPREKDCLLVHAGQHLFPFRTEDVAATRVPLAESPQLPTPSPIKSESGGEALLTDSPSAAAVHDGSLYLLDGEHYLVTDGKMLRSVSDGAYVPLIALGGKAYEQKNLLTNEVREEFSLSSPKDFPFYTEEDFIFSLDSAGFLTVIGYDGSEELVVLPPRARFAGREYTVAAVGSFAFRGNETVRTLVLSDGIVTLAPDAFSGMRALTEAVLPESITEIPERCFDGCPSLLRIFLPRGLRAIGEGAFAAASVTELHFGGKEEDFGNVDGGTQLRPASPPEGFSAHFESFYPVVRCHFPLFAEVEELRAVLLGGEPLAEALGEPFYRFSTSEDGTGRLFLEAARESSILGKTLSLSYLCREDSPSLAGAPPGVSDGRAAICGCRLVAAYEGRLFLSGNPALPGTVFYSGIRSDGVSDPSYIGVYQHFTDGDGGAAVTFLLPTETALWVMTEERPTRPSLFCHEGKEGDSDLLPRIYPVCDAIGGMGSLGAAISFRGERLFLSPFGLESIERDGISGERRILHRSGAIDARLTREDVTRAHLFHWGSYLGIAIEDRVYLADGRRTVTRDGQKEYEWYYLSGIGSFRGDSKRYRISTVLPPALVGLSTTHDKVDYPFAPAKEERYADGMRIHSILLGGKVYPYVLVGEEAHSVFFVGERYGGTLCPATAFAEADSLLFFGTTEGLLMVFETDRRREDATLPREAYTFCGHAYTSGFATPLDDCDRKTARKTTVKGAGAVRFKAMAGGKVRVLARTELGDWTHVDTLFPGRASFEETDFSSADFHTGDDVVLPFRESKRRWVEKQLFFVSEEYQRPFGILSVAYRYRVAGRI